MDVVKELMIATTKCEFCLLVHVVKLITRGYPHHMAMQLPISRQVVRVWHYHFSGGHEDIGQTILQLEKVKIIRPMHSPNNSPVRPVKKPDGIWRMTVDYRELNKDSPGYTLWCQLQWILWIALH